MKQRLLGLLPGLVAIAALIGLVGPAVYSQTSVANSPADLAGKILMVADSATARTVTNTFTYTGLQTFDRGAAAPFAIGASSTKVIGLDADKLDGLDSTGFLTNPYTGNLAVTGNVSATGSVTGGSYLGPVVIPLNKQTGAVANSGVAETTLFTYTLTAGKLAAANDAIHIYCFGTGAANADTKTLRLYFGSTVLETRVFNNAIDIAWKMTGEVLRTGAATQTALGTWDSILTGTDLATSSPTETLSGTVIIKITGQSGTGSNDVTGLAFMVDFSPGI